MSDQTFFDLTLIRHGESLGNANGLIQGQSDLGLTLKGIEQATKVASYWNSQKVEFNLIISSPLIRAQQTAEIIADQLKVPIEYNHLWKERGFGEIDGSVYNEIIQSDPPPDFYHPYLPPAPSGESLMDTYHRAGEAVRDLITRPAARYLVVSHGALLNMAMYAILGVSPHSSPRSPRFYFANTGFMNLHYLSETNQWRIIKFLNPEEL